jgi:hypothetical protein
VAQRSQDRWAQEQRLEISGLDTFAAPRLINYVRRGDGFTYRAAIGPDRRARVLGSVVDLEPLDPTKIEEFERYLQVTLPGSLRRRWCIEHR